MYNNSTYCNENQLVAKPCENFTLLENKVKYLIKTYAWFTIGKTNLEAVIGSQNCAFGKAEIPYNSFNKKKFDESLFPLF